MRVWLRFTEGALAGETREVQIGESRSALVGRAPQCDVILGETDRAASSTHAKIWLDHDAVFITDVGSHYGLFVNDRAIMKAKLGQNDRVRFGIRGPEAQISFQDAPEPLPLQPVPRRVVKKQRPVAMTTVRMVPQDLGGPAPTPAAPGAPAEPPAGATPDPYSLNTLVPDGSGGFQRVGSGSGAFRPVTPAGTAAATARGDSGALRASGADSGAVAAPGPNDDPSQWKQCPFCAESIRAAAVKCRYCGEFLPVGSGSASGSAPAPGAANGASGAAAATSASGGVAPAGPKASAASSASGLAAALEVPGRPIEGGTQFFPPSGDDTVMLGERGAPSGGDGEADDEGTIIIEPEPEPEPAREPAQPPPLAKAVAAAGPAATPAPAKAAAGPVVAPATAKVPGAASGPVAAPAKPAPAAPARGADDEEAVRTRDLGRLVEPDEGIEADPVDPAALFAELGELTPPPPPALTPPPPLPRDAASDDDDDDDDDDVKAIEQQEALIARLADQGRTPEEILSTLETIEKARSARLSAVSAAPAPVPAANGGGADARGSNAGARTIVGMPSFDDDG